MIGFGKRVRSLFRLLITTARHWILLSVEPLSDFRHFIVFLPGKHEPFADPNDDFNCGKPENRKFTEKGVILWSIYWNNKYISAVCNSSFHIDGLHHRRMP